MANTDIKRSFTPIDGSYHKSYILEKKASESLASKPGDVVYLDSAGRIDDAASAIIGGLQMDGIRDQVTGAINAIAAVDDLVNVLVDPATLFIGQITTGALADPYTTRSSAACFDVAGNAGVQYVDAGAHSNDTIKVVNPHFEYAAGEASAIGAYQKAIFKFNQLKHHLGVIA